MLSVIPYCSRQEDDHSDYQYFDEEMKANTMCWAKWQVQIQDWRVQLGCLGMWEVLRPWTSLPNRKYLGIKPGPRILAILGLVTIEILGGAESTAKLLSEHPSVYVPKIVTAMEGIIVDVSQNPIRRAFTNNKGISKCMTTSSQLYSYKRDGLILPREQLYFQGHSRALKFPPKMSQKSIHDLAGVGISLPCLGMIFSSMLVTTGL